MDNQPSQSSQSSHPSFYGVKKHAISQTYSVGARVFSAKIELGSYSDPVIAACVFDLFKLLRGLHIDPFVNRARFNFPEASYASKIDQLIQRGIIICPLEEARSTTACRALFDYYYQARGRIQGPRGRLYNPSRRTAEGVHPVDKYLQLLAAYNARQVSSYVPQALPDNMPAQQIEPLPVNAQLQDLKEPDLAWLDDLLRDDIVNVDELHRLTPRI